ncbi:MAG: GGDEF domain-containing protein [Cellvibrionales bacterium]|nr:GGDEF domain-containing protein [Cellvibrionales bacterium]
MSDIETGSPWKLKYLELIKEQELVALEWQKKIDELHRGVAKISIAAQGQDVTLDAALEGVRQSLNDKTGASLSAQIDALETGIHAMDDSRIKRTNQTTESLATLLEQLQTVKIDRPSALAINKLGKELKKSANRLTEPFDLELWLEKVVAAQNNALQSLDPLITPPKAPPVQKSLLPTLLLNLRHRLMGAAVDTQTKAGSEVNRVNAEQTSATLAKNVIENTPQAIAEHKDNADSYEAVRVEVVAVLLGLLADIDVPADAQHFANQLYKDLQNGLEWPDFIPALDKVVTVVIAALGRDQRQFEQFLQGLNQQLLEIGSFISFVDHSQLISNGQTQDLSDELDSHVSDIVSRFESDDATQDLEGVVALKDSVSDKLKTIVTSLEQFQSNQGEQQALMAQQLLEMTTRVESMDGDVQEASDKLQKQRDKLLRDTLTDLPNREAYNIRVQQEYDRWQRYGRPLVLAVADVDFFKRTNEEFGHEAGDRMLKIIGKTMLQQLRKTDFIARFSGAQFTILLPETSLQAGQQALEKLRIAVQACPLRFAKKPLTITISLGATLLAEGDTIVTARHRADQACAMAKSSGRNCYRTIIK